MWGAGRAVLLTALIVTQGRVENPPYQSLRRGGLSALSGSVCPAGRQPATSADAED